MATMQGKLLHAFILKQQSSIYSDIEIFKQDLCQPLASMRLVP